MERVKGDELERALGRRLLRGGQRALIVVLALAAYGLLASYHALAGLPGPRVVEASGGAVEYHLTAMTTPTFAPFAAAGLVIALGLWWERRRRSEEPRSAEGPPAGPVRRILGWVVTGAFIAVLVGFAAVVVAIDVVSYRSVVVRGGEVELRAPFWTRRLPRSEIDRAEVGVETIRRRDRSYERSYFLVVDRSGRRYRSFDGGDRGAEGVLRRLEAELSSPGLER